MSKWLAFDNDFGILINTSLERLIVYEKLERLLVYKLDFHFGSNTKTKTYSESTRRYAQLSYLS